MFLESTHTMPFLRDLARRLKSHAKAARTRRLRMEALDPRAMLAVLPYGAMPDDTGEFMLGDVYVNVVLVESDATKPTLGGGAADADLENWTTGEVADVTAKVNQALDWWKGTLYEQFPQTPPDLLKFDVGFSTFHTGYEPIARVSDDFSLWVSDYLSSVGISASGGWSPGIRAYNHQLRTEHDSEWAFTMFVVDNSNDLLNDQSTPGGFAAGGSFTNAFAYAGGRFLVVQSGRPASTFAHEVGHMFWALDEYAGSDYQTHRGYYDTPNSNSVSNPDLGAEGQKPSIMSNGPGMQAAFNDNTSAPSTLEMIGWKDQDNDGIMDVLDVPFSLQGDGWYNETTGEYNFYGKSAVRTLQNRNPSGLQNDITINHIRQAQYKVDDGDWQVIATYDDSSAYSAQLDFSFPVELGEHEIRIRTYDTRTHVASDEFVGHMDQPASIGNGGISGYVWYDQDQDGTYDTGEQPNVDFGLELVDAQGNVLNLRHTLTPSFEAVGTQVNAKLNGAQVAAIGADVFGQSVEIMKSAITQENVLGTHYVATGEPVTDWNIDTRYLRFTLDQPTTTFQMRAIGARSAPSFARLDGYDSAGNLVARTTSMGLDLRQDQTLILNRTAADIKYVIARVFQTGSVEFADFAWGPLGSGTTNFLGAYSFPYLPPGQYFLRPIAPPLHVPTTYAGVDPEVDLTASGNAIINFGYVLAPNPWFNPINAFDVNADGGVTIRDATQIIQWIRRNNGGGALGAQVSGAPANYLDVNYDGQGDVKDAIAVIKELRRQARLQSGGEGDGAEEATTPAAVVSPAAAGYFAGEPVHFNHVPGDDEEEHQHEETDVPSGAKSDTPVTVVAMSQVAEAARSQAISTDSSTPAAANNLSLFWNLFASNGDQSDAKKHFGTVIDLLAEDASRRS
jgi:hypothetical protein